MWKRKLRSAAIMTFVLLVSLAVIGAAMAANNSLNPYAICDDVGAGGEKLDCAAIWDLESTSAAAPGARADIMPFIARDTDVFACKAHVEFGVWVADMSAANGFFVDDADAGAAAAFRASAGGERGVVGGHLSRLQRGRVRRARVPPLLLQREGFRRVQRRCRRAGLVLQGVLGRPDSGGGVPGHRRGGVDGDEPHPEGAV
jgi:hypothetical protein